MSEVERALEGVGWHPPGRGAVFVQFTFVFHHVLLRLVQYPFNFLSVHIDTQVVYH